MTSRSAFAALLTFGALAAIGCRTPTSVTVTVTTDATCADLKGVTITARAPDALEAAGPTTTTRSCAAQADGTSRIGSIVVVPSAGDGDEIAIRVVAGLDRPAEECTAANAYRGCVVARRVVRFAAHVELTIPIAVRRGCKDVACDASTTCVEGACRSAELTDPESCSGEGCLAGLDGGVDAADSGDASDATDAADATDAPDATEAGDGAPSETGGCGSGQKNCGGTCVRVDDPAFGCSAASCSPCSTFANATYACAAGACAATGCLSGFKSCGGNCVAKDAAHGCADSTCDPCPAVGGVASCTASGACQLKCDSGYKLCGGKCVSIGDPNFGCGATTCDNSTCPTPGPGGTVVCSGGACVLGSCGAGTKACAGACVPTDAAHGCADVTRCTACAKFESCVGGPPTTCQCVPQSQAITCFGVQCGSKLNNCGQLVDCGGLCGKPQTCGGGGVPNQCGCTTVTNPCDGVSCGTLLDNCLNPVSCGCTGYNSCGGGGIAGKCGCTSVSPCDGLHCGNFPDNCGVKTPCGCTGLNTCGGGGTLGICGCKPKTALEACVDLICGSAPDGCGGTVSCGTCALNQKCCGYACTCKTCECPLPQ